MQDRHTRDRGARLHRGRVDGVIGTDHQDDIGLVELVVDLVHLVDDVVGHAGLGEQHIHVAGQPSGNRVDRESHLDAGLGEPLGQLGHRILGLRDRHAVAGSDHHRTRIGEPGSQLVGLDLLDLTGRPLGGGRSGGAETTEDHRDERAVHGLAHDVAQDRARSAHQGTGDDQHVHAQGETAEGSRESGVAVQHRDDHRHIRTADSGNQVEAQEQAEQGQHNEREP